MSVCSWWRDCACADFTYTYDPANPAGERITSMSFNGARIQPTDTYTVVTNSFFAGGGDNFVTFAGPGDGLAMTGAQTPLGIALLAAMLVAAGLLLVPLRTRRTTM